jgi:hypothetical protein
MREYNAMATVNYEKYIVKKPIRQEDSRPGVKNRTFPPLIYMSSARIPEVKYNIEFGWVWGLPEPAFYAEHVYEHDEIILNIGGDCWNPEDLGAEIEYTIGGQTLNIGTTSALFVPRGVRHGLLAYKGFSRPHVRISVLLGTGEREEARVAGAGFSQKSKAEPQIDYEKYLVRKPAYEVVPGTPVKNRQGPSSMTMMSNNLVPGCNIYIEGGWVWGMPEPNPHIFEHVHDYEEIVIHFGTDYENPEELGAEIDFFVGGQPLKVDKTSAVFVPRGVRHGPLVWRTYISPHLEMAIMPGAGTLDEADPGGHREKMKRRDSNHG